MNKLLLLLMSATCTLAAAAQKMNGPAEILKIMTDSKVSFQVEALADSIRCIDRSENLNSHDAYRVANNGNFEVKYAAYTGKAKEYYDIAEDYFQKDNPDSALVYYLKALQVNPDFYPVYTYVGQMYEKKSDWDNAIKWYQQAISKNYIDYMPHWFLADAYSTVNRKDEAVSEILVASILNRNNVRLKEALTHILRTDNRNVEEWCFNPQMELAQKDGTVQIRSNNSWMIYALAKAVWAYEPDYKKSQGIPADSYDIKEEREALYCMLLGIENSKTDISKDKQLVVLSEAVAKEHFNNFIIYDVMLPQHPSISYFLTPEQIESIKQYLLNVRYKKMNTLPQNISLL